VIRTSLIHKKCNRDKGLVTTTNYNNIKNDFVKIYKNHIEFKSAILELNKSLTNTIRNMKKFNAASRIKM